MGCVSIVFLYDWNARFLREHKGSKEDTMVLIIHYLCVESRHTNTTVAISRHRCYFPYIYLNIQHQKYAQATYDSYAPETGIQGEN